ncbi:MAG: hemolysin III family protein [Lachnospiraceae bacterium]|nr:hemolysin III family protein [Lachnospiraceae bacterium]
MSSKALSNLRQPRTKLRDRVLPDYTKGEEIFNMVSHIVGGALGIAALVLCVVKSALKGDTWGVVTSSIYGSSLIILYTMSSVYHGLHKNMGKKVMQVIDHCTIYYLIGGTYTVIVLAGVRKIHPGWAWTIFGIVWGMSIAAAVFTAIDHNKYRRLSMICYIAIGWCIVIAAKPTVEAIGWAPVIWILGGGVSYTIGAVLYSLGKKNGKRYIHSVFHLFVLAGSILQFFAIYLYIL